MTHWRLADTKGTDCAYGCKIPAGAAYQVIFLTGVTQGRRRCERHAIGTAPENLEPTAEREPVASTFKPMRSFGLPKQLADARQRQAGELTPDFVSTHACVQQARTERS